MRRAVLLAALVLPLMAAAPSRPVPVAGLSGATVAPQGDNLRLRLRGGAVTVLSRDGDCAPCRLEGAARLPGGPPGALALTTEHLSRGGVPTGMCGAGTELVLHLLLQRGSRWHEAAALRVESCWLSMEAHGPPRWDGRVLRVGRWAATPEGLVRHAWRVEAGGTVTRLEGAP